MLPKGLKILDLAPGATIQDGGRPGYQRYGVTTGGAMDLPGLVEGQILLDNDRNAAALEFAGLGGRFVSHSRLAIATSGAAMVLKLGGQTQPWRCSHIIEAGQVVEIGQCRWGVYGYLHLQGGIECTPVLGSRSTHIMARLGWTPQCGEVLEPISDLSTDSGLCLPTPEYFEERLIRILPGPQTPLFSEDDISALINSAFSISWSRNRIGARLNCTEHIFAAGMGKSLVSAPTIAGDIQISADGQATVLMADCQPMGGYPRIATIISADFHKFVQLQAGEEFCFAWTTLNKALTAHSELREAMARLPKRRGQLPARQPSLSDLMHHTLISGAVKGDDFEVD